MSCTTSNVILRCRLRRLPPVTDAYSSLFSVIDATHRGHNIASASSELCAPPPEGCRRCYCASWWPWRSGSPWQVLVLQAFGPLKADMSRSKYGSFWSTRSRRAFAIDGPMAVSGVRGHQHVCPILIVLAKPWLQYFRHSERPRSPMMKLAAVTPAAAARTHARCPATATATTAALAPITANVPWAPTALTAAPVYHCLLLRRSQAKRPPQPRQIVQVASSGVC